MNKPYVVVFAGVPGSSKSIIAHYLSCQFSLPIIANDVIRSEVKEDLLIDNITAPHALTEYRKRADRRHAAMLAGSQSYIRDNSVDREWHDIKVKLQAAGFNWFLINMELSEDFMLRLYEQTGRPKAMTQLADYMKQHQEFVDKYANDISISIADDQFLRRLEISQSGLKKFINTPSG